MRNKNMTRQSMIPLRWCGGKTSIINELYSRLPTNYSSYVEPFVGGGTLFFNTKPQNKNVILADVNQKLIYTYQSIRDNVDDIIVLLKQHQSKNCEEYYYEAREAFNQETNPIIIAGLLLYLNKTGYNALYRVNKKGLLNVPFNKHPNPNIINEYALRHTSQLLKNVCVLCQSFTRTPIMPGAFYYMDPPYFSSFDQYDETRFNAMAHEQLLELCDKINVVGGYFMLSNSDNDFVRQLYSKYNIEQVESRRSISSKGNGRGKCIELIIRNY
jgi:DNA adenine methylase